MVSETQMVHWPSRTAVRSILIGIRHCAPPHGTGSPGSTGWLQSCPASSLQRLWPGFLAKFSTYSPFPYVTRVACCHFSKPNHHVHLASFQWKRNWTVILANDLGMFWLLLPPKNIQESRAVYSGRAPRITGSVAEYHSPLQWPWSTSYWSWGFTSWGWWFEQ